MSREAYRWSSSSRLRLQPPVRPSWSRQSRWACVPVRAAASGDVVEGLASAGVWAVPVDVCAKLAGARAVAPRSAHAKASETDFMGSSGDKLFEGNAGFRKPVPRQGRTIG